MKIIRAFVLSLIAYSSLSFADNQPVNVRIVTDSDFKDYNILFIADGPTRQEVGFHEAGGSLISNKEAKPVSGKDRMGFQPFSPAFSLSGFFGNFV